MKLLVLGAGGMLGHKMVQELVRAGHEVHGTIRDASWAEESPSGELFAGATMHGSVDALDWRTVRDVLDEVRADAVMNCIGVIKQRNDATRALPSIAINALLPHRLAEYVEKRNARLVHFSTDCVFSGRRGHYTENDESDALDLYGKSKFLGEVRGSASSLTLRTSIIGRELAHFASLLEWFLGAAEKSRVVSGFTGSIYSGVTTNYLSRLVVSLLESHQDLNGLYQVASPAITKYDLLTLIRDAYGLDVEVAPVEGELVDRSMSGEKFREATGIPEPTWEALVQELAADPTPYSTFYTGGTRV